MIAGLLGAMGPPARELGRWKKSLEGRSSLKRSVSAPPPSSSGLHGHEAPLTDLMQNDRASALRSARHGHDLSVGFQRRSIYLPRVMKRLVVEELHRPWQLTEYARRLIGVFGKFLAL